ncbi:MAG TPA: hypothetical protein VGS41_03100, partial [Chthonomonadales bacterium]|nr:hypothetical protein [Chthonomonadales bacterium]
AVRYRRQGAGILLPCNMEIQWFETLSLYGRRAQTSREERGEESGEPQQKQPARTQAHSMDSGEIHDYIYRALSGGEWQGPIAAGRAFTRSRGVSIL